jgi:hypothetical protein
MKREPLEVFETLAATIGWQDARDVLVILDGYAPKWKSTEDMIKRRRAWSILSERPDITAGQLANRLSVPRSTAGKWIKEWKMKKLSTDRLIVDGGSCFTEAIEESDC